MRGALGEAAWAMKCCFSGTKVADLACAILYLLVGGFLFTWILKRESFYSTLNIFYLALLKHRN